MMAKSTTDIADGFAAVEKDEGGLVDVERQDQGGVDRTALGHDELGNEDLQAGDHADDGEKRIVGCKSGSVM